MVDVPKFFHEIHEFMKDRERAHEAAFDLWSWHPEVRRAEMFHGDYADEVQPNDEWVMRESARLISYLFGYDDRGLEEAMKLEDSEPFQCYCGEFHDPSIGKFHDDWPQKRESAYEHMEHIKAIHEFAMERLGR